MINGMILILILIIFRRSLMAMSLNVPLIAYINLNLFAFPEHLRMLITSLIVTNSYLQNFLSKAIGIINSAFSKFYRRHFELIEQYHVSLKKLMQQGNCNPEFYGDLVYEFKKIDGNPNFSNLFKCIVNRFKRTGYS